MFCREVKAFISPYLDGQLDNGQTRQLEQHVVSCPSCRQRLGLMEEIPSALRTDRMLAPQPEFTKVVMQQVIVRQQISPRLAEIGTRTTTLQATKVEIKASERETSFSSKIVSFGERPHQRAKSPSAYVLRFSSVAAVAVVMITVGVFFVTNNSPGNLSATSAAVYGGIQSFADTVSNALSRPVDLLVGVILAAAFMVGLWYEISRAKRTQR